MSSMTENNIHILNIDAQPGGSRRFKTLADRQKRVSDDDIQALMTDEVQPNAIWDLMDVQVRAWHVVFFAWWLM